ncbi:unnamed protein product [Rotaria sordida]|uniref:TIR domain-containing protein n=1 Tax=Rotaria sordida TaxID=392033 RepID=A0A819VYZ8_9BILA|nr:unnamed protein product [Rotaria sordida]
MANTNVDIERYILIFDDLFEKLQKSKDNEEDDTIVKALSAIQQLPNVVLMNLVDHKLFIEIRSTLIHLLEKWSKTQLNERDHDILEKIIKELAGHYRGMDLDVRHVRIYDNLLFDLPLLNIIKMNIDNISMKSMDDPVLSCFVTLINRLIYLSDFSDDEERSNMLKPIFDSLKQSLSDGTKEDDLRFPYYTRFVTFDDHLEKSIIDHDVIDTITKLNLDFRVECLIGHKLFLKIISTLTNLFDKWLTLNEYDKLTCSKIIDLFKGIYYPYWGIGLDNILNRTSLINTIKTCLEHSLKIKTYDDQYFSNLSKLISVLTLEKQYRNDLEIILKPLNQLLLAYITSIDYKISLEQIESEPFTYNKKDEFYLITCVSLILSVDEDIQDELFNKMSKYYEHTLKQLISRSNNIFENKSIIRSLMYINEIFKRLYTTKGFLNVIDDFILLFHMIPIDFQVQYKSEEEPDEYKKMDWTVWFCYFPEDLESLDERSILIKLIYNILYKIYECVSDPDIISIIKDKHITETILKLININCKSIQLVAYNILALVMSENDVKTLVRPDKITSIFIEYLEQLDKDFNPYRDNHNIQLINALKAILQHDKTKNEFIKQNGLLLIIKLFMTCYNVTDYDLKAITSDALELIWTLAFDEQIAQFLKQNQLFMTNVKSILTIETNKYEYDQKNEEKNVERLKKAAHGILWLLENEEKALKNTKNEQQHKHEYDLMISYSWNDMDLSHQVCDYLTKNKHYKIWIDRDEMHGSTIDSMAEAIEKSDIVLMCMSETYKRSENCKAEAEYARKRKRCIIPLMMREKYDPDGWLGFICGQKLYIDFTQYKFETAAQKLISEIENYRQNKQQQQQLQSSSLTTPISTQHSTVPKLTSSVMAIKEETKSAIQETIQQSTKISDSLNTMEQWSKEDVIDFFHKQKLDLMLLLFPNTNGWELVYFYGMCKIDTNKMYFTLKEQLCVQHNKYLPIDIYLRFIRQLKEHILD